MIAQGEHPNQSGILMMPKVAMGRGWRSGLVDLRSSQVSHEEKEEGVGGNVQVEIDETVNEKAAASHQSAELQSRGKRVIQLAKTLYELPEQDTQKPRATEASEQTCFGQGLKVVVVGMVDDFSVVK
jgi:hypothetical protein